MKIKPTNPFNPLVFILLANGAFGQHVEIKDSKVRQEIDAATKNVLDSLFKAFETLDTDQIMAMYANGEKVLHISNMGIVQIDTISSYTRAALKEIEYFKVKWNPVSMKILSHEIGLRVIRFSFFIKKKNEAETISNGIQTFVFKKLGSNWKIVHDQRIEN